MVAKGLIINVGGVVAVLASFSFGWGPCGPSSPFALVLLFGGIAMFLIGLITTSTGLIRILIRHAQHHSGLEGD